MKQSFRCPKCESPRVGRIGLPSESLSEKRESAKMWARSHRQFPVREFLLNYWLCEKYVCTECGYFEEYVLDPQEIPWERVEEFQWCRGEPQEAGPYRSE